MVDYDKYHALRIAELERTGGAAKDGLTVRDYFAANAMMGLIRHFDFDTFAQDPMRVASWSYDAADAMMKERDRKQSEPCSVEEAFGLPQ